MRININYNLDDDFYSWALKVNKNISRLTENEIDFSSKLCLPHITLLMGEIEEKNLEKIKDLVKDFKSIAVNSLCSLSKPYINDEYVFADVLETENLKKDCQALINLLGDLIVPHRCTMLNGGGQRFIPHVTLGYTENSNDIKEYISTIKSAPEAILKGISVNIAGKHGTVICNEPVEEPLGIEK